MAKKSQICRVPREKIITEFDIAEREENNLYFDGSDQLYDKIMKKIKHATKEGKPLKLVLNFKRVKYGPERETAPNDYVNVMQLTIPIFPASINSYTNSGLAMLLNNETNSSLKSNITPYEQSIFEEANQIYNYVFHEITLKYLQCRKYAIENKPKSVELDVKVNTKHPELTPSLSEYIPENKRNQKKKYDAVFLQCVDMEKAIAPEFDGTFDENYPYIETRKGVDYAKNVKLHHSLTEKQSRKFTGLTLPHLKSLLSDNNYVLYKNLLGKRLEVVNRFAQSKTYDLK